MEQRLRVLFVTPEVTPFARTGGLGDVAGALPKALAALGHDVRVVMPLYQAVRAGAGTFDSSSGGRVTHVIFPQGYQSSGRRKFLAF